MIPELEEELELDEELYFETDNRELEFQNLAIQEELESSNLNEELTAKLDQDDRKLTFEREYFSLLNGLSLSELNTLGNFSQFEFEELLELKPSDAKMAIRKIDAFETSQPLTSLTFDELEFGRALRLNVIQKEIDKTGMNLKERMRADSIKETTEDLREIYYDYYDNNLKGILRDFILDTEAPEILHFESRLKSNASAYRSITCKDHYNSADELNDIIGIRFIVNNEQDARELVNLFYKRKILDDKNFKLKDSRDYFVTPKVDLETGKIQYRGLHLLLQDNNDDFYKFELQVHTRETYRSTELTHRVYEGRKRQKRITQKINFNGIQ